MHENFNVYINNKRLVPGQHSQYKWLLTRDGHNDNSTIVVNNITKNNLAQLHLKITFVSGLELHRKMQLNITGKLQLCDNEISSQSIPVSIGMRSTVFFCVTSDFGLGTHLALNNVSIHVNDFSKKLKYAASTYTRYTNYFINLFIENITTEDIAAHLLWIKPTLYRNIYINFRLYLKDVNEPHFCNHENPKLIYFPKKDATFELNLSVNSAKYYVERVQVENGMTRLNEVKALTNFTVVTSKDGFSHIIGMIFAAIKDHDLTQYTFIMTFTRNKKLTYTFYLQNRTEKQSNPCFLEATHKVVLARLGDSPRLCIETHGVLEDYVIINNVTRVIDRDVMSTNLNVSYVWSEELGSSFIEIKIVNISLGDFSSYEVRLTFLDMNYTFEVKMKQGPPRIKSFNAGQASSVLTHNNVTVYVLTLGDVLIQTCEAEFINTTFRLSITKGLETTMNTTESDVVLTHGIRDVKCSDSGVYYCTAHARPSTQVTSSVLGIAVLDCKPQLCETQKKNQQQMKSIGDVLKLSLCVKVYIKTNFTLTWNGKVLNNSSNSSHRFELRPTRRPLEWDWLITISSIQSSDYGVSKLSLRVDTGEPLELAIPISAPNKPRNIYEKGLIAVVLIAVLTFVILGGICVAVYVILQGLLKIKKTISNDVIQQTTEL